MGSCFFDSFHLNEEPRPGNSPNNLYVLVLITSVVDLVVCMTCPNALTLQCSQRSTSCFMLVQDYLSVLKCLF